MTPIVNGTLADAQKMKGKRPVSIVVSGQEYICRKWLDVAEIILRDCDKTCHDALIDLRGKVAGRRRTVLAEIPDGMRRPIQLSENLFFEGKFDTEFLLKMVLTIVKAACYDYEGVCIKYKAG